MAMTDARSRALVETDRLWGLDAVPFKPGVIEARSTAANDRSEEPRKTETTQRPATTPPSPPNDPAPVNVLEAAVSPGLPSVEENLEAIRAHHAEHCPLCREAAGARNIVFGEGAPRAELAFVGEAPGEQEDRTGRPFVGRAGELLDRMIAALDLSRDAVWVSNVVKTRPPENRTPRPDEAAVCGRWLASELVVIRPRAVIALGGTPAKHLLGTSTGITRLRGIWGACRVGDLDIPVMPTFHPAFVLRQYTPEVRGAVWQDLQAAWERASS